MNMDEYFVLFREYMLVQKPSSVNTRDSYLRDVSAFLRYLEGENITSPLEVETETVEAYVQHLHSLNRTNSTISRNIASVRCFYKFLILRGDMQVNPAKSVKLEKEPKKLPQTLTSEEIDLLLSQPNVTEAKGAAIKRCWSFFMPPVFASVSSSTSTCRISTCAPGKAVLPRHQGRAHHSDLCESGRCCIRLSLPYAPI